MLIILPFLVAIVGVLVYILAANPKVSELGRITFFVGLFFFVMAISTGESILSLFAR